MIDISFNTCNASFCHNVGTFRYSNDLIGDDFRCEDCIKNEHNYRPCCATFYVSFTGEEITQMDLMQNYSKLVKRIFEKLESLRLRLCRGDVVVILCSDNNNSHLVYDTTKRENLWYLSQGSDGLTLSGAMGAITEFPLDYWAHLNIRQFGINTDSFIDQIEKNICLPDIEKDEDITASSFKCGEKEYTLIYQCKTKQEFLNRLQLTKTVKVDKEHEILTIC